MKKAPSDELKRVCDTFLRCADLYLSLNGESGDLELRFIAASGTTDISFRCRRIHFMNIVQNFDDEPPCFVGGTSVTVRDDVRRALSEHGWGWGDRPLPERLFEIKIEGAIEVEVLCADFEWDHRSISQEPRAKSQEP